MKNKEVIVYFIVSLMILMPIVSADNFLTGRSILDEVGNFFSSVANFFKESVLKKTVGKEQAPEDEPPNNLCGDNIINPYSGEECDGNRMPNQIPGCESKGFGVGIIDSCNDNCRFDTSQCPWKLTTNVVGSGTISKSPDKDGYNRDGTESVTLTANPSENSRFLRWEGISGRNNNLENSQVTIRITNNLVITSHFSCGNSIIDIGEECDGEELGGESCESLDYDSGILRCDNNCRFDTSQCIATFTGVDFEEELIDEDEDGYYTNPNLMGLEVDCNDNDPNINPGRIERENQNENLCKDNKDNDCDEKIDCEDTGCNNANSCHENQCNDDEDDDHDGLIDNLDPDCNLPGLSLTEMRILDTEFYQYERIPSIECTYSIADRTPAQVKECVNLTMRETNNLWRDISCDQIAGYEGAEGNLDFIKFLNCNSGNNLGEKDIRCEVKSKCNGYPDSTVPTMITVEEFTTCNDGEGKANSNLFNVFQIASPTNNEEFEFGETVNIELRLQHIYENEFGEFEPIDITAKASLIDIITWDEIVTSFPVEIEELRFIQGPETFELSMVIPQNLNSGYRLYVKAYMSGNGEEELCNSNSIALRVQEPSEDDEPCPDDDDDGYCNDNDCNDTDNEINPGKIEFCEDGIDNNCDGITDYADELCVSITGNQGSGGSGSQSGGQESDESDSDNDGLPDYWEYNHFGNLNQGPYDDPDNDGITNIDEYTFNSNPKVSEKKGTSILTILLIIIGAIVIIGVIIFLAKFMKAKPRSGYLVDQSSQGRIQKYIQEARAQGMKRQDIKKSLLNAGWKESDINRFL